MAETDHHLVHLQSFTSNPSYSNIPDIIKKGMPLFYLPQNSSNPEVNLQQQSSKYVKWSNVHSVVYAGCTSQTEISDESDDSLYLLKNF